MVRTGSRCFHSWYQRVSDAPRTPRISSRISAVVIVDEGVSATAHEVLSSRRSGGAGHLPPNEPGRGRRADRAVAATEVGPRGGPDPADGIFREFLPVSPTNCN